MAAVLPSPPPISLRFRRPSSFTSVSSSSSSSSSGNSFPVSRRSRRGLRIYAGKYIREDYLIKKKSAKEVEELVKGKRKVPLIIDFYATWCGPCILMAQVLETLAVEYEQNALFVKVDTDEEFDFSIGMQVRGLPTLVFVSPDPSKDAIRAEGLLPIDMIRNIINDDM